MDTPEYPYAPDINDGTDYAVIETDGGDRIDPVPPYPVIVATITIEAAREIRRPEESFAAYHVVRVEPGTYPVELRTDGSGSRYLAAVFSGIVTASGYGSRRDDKRIGATGELILYPYKYQLRGGRFIGAVTVLDEQALATAGGV